MICKLNEMNINVSEHMNNKTYFEDLLTSINGKVK